MLKDLKDPKVILWNVFGVAICASIIWGKHFGFLTFLS